MNRHKIDFSGKFLVVTIISLLAFSTVLANENRHISLVAETLSEKLQNDLAQDKVKVDLTNVREHKVSENQIRIEGDGVCLTEDGKNRLPLRFNAKLNTSKQVVSDIEYDFVEPSPEFAPTSNEEVLMRELMKKISVDYSTQNIVIAIDNYENVSGLTKQNEFTGVGEVRIGDFTWSTIKFDIVLAPENTGASRIIYKIDK